MIEIDQRKESESRNKPTQFSVDKVLSKKDSCFNRWCMNNMDIWKKINHALTSQEHKTYLQIATRYEHKS